MISFGDPLKENIKEHNANWPILSDHPHKILIIGCSESGKKKKNSSSKLISHQPDIDLIYLNAKGPYTAKYQFLINKWENKSLNHFNDSKAFIEYSNVMDDIY